MFIERCLCFTPPSQRGGLKARRRGEREAAAEEGLRAEPSAASPKQVSWDMAPALLRIKPPRVAWFKPPQPSLCSHVRKCSGCQPFTPGLREIPGGIGIKFSVLMWCAEMVVFFPFFPFVYHTPSLHGGVVGVNPATLSVESHHRLGRIS